DKTGGYIHIMNIDPTVRPSSLPYKGMAMADTSPAGEANDGVASTSPFPIQLPNNESAFGGITISGSVAFISTANQVITQPLAISASSQGNTYMIDLAGA